ncbi:DUF4331 family protein [Luteirhabdus pelagi]|uniref:DUF4331 family protein n=1 Tax=Luteirhabdus pelagi TaxID=2792783 RepID=UPI00193A8890|nr:DUF4331 family protein [Luteirhabdus pelagi]
MKRTKLLAAIAGIGIVVVAAIFVAADHIDAPAVAGSESDITDFYAFQGQNTDNLVFVTNVQGLLAPGSTDQAEFDENVLLEINIDRDNDLVEDLVIQMIRRNDSMYFFGPVQTGSNNTGLTSVIDTDAVRNSVKISTVDSVETAENNGMMFFAGPREDPFYFDFDQYNEVVAGNSDGFEDPGTDTFAGTNVLSVVVEVPKSMLGPGATGANPLMPDTPIYNTWVESKRKQ